MAWSDGRTIVDEDTDVPQLLWRELCLPFGEQSDKVRDLDVAFGNYLNEVFTACDVMEYVCPRNERGGCTEEDFLFDWLTDMAAHDRERFTELTGFEEVRLRWMRR